MSRPVLTPRGFTRVADIELSPQFAQAAPLSQDTTISAWKAFIKLWKATGGL
jgi:hypothetical protein